MPFSRRKSIKVSTDISSQFYCSCNGGIFLQDFRALRANFRERQPTFSFSIRQLKLFFGLIKFGDNILVTCRKGSICRQCAFNKAPTADERSFRKVKWTREFYLPPERAPPDS
ncbi:hypothetical protein TcasGA2_TC002901 [Tribolium castaneum]|uniref:Uncharacterized protein n=1 Tax=Tribolium castaneum TaxID=7070 RepID=D6WHH5_TRICA|nr:hypothetical protein TcasGA2_TC002901 [Tribolium castaneum]